MKWPALRQHPSIRAPACIIPISDRKHMTSRSFAVSYTPPATPDQPSLAARVSEKSIASSHAERRSRPGRPQRTRGTASEPGTPIDALYSSWHDKRTGSRGRYVSRTLICYYYPFCVKGRSCTFLHPHEAKNGQNVDAVLAGSAIAASAMHEQRLSIDGQKKRGLDRQRALSKKGKGRRGSSYTTWRVRPSQTVAQFVSDTPSEMAIPFATSSGFRSDVLPGGRSSDPINQSAKTGEVEGNLSVPSKYDDTGGGVASAQADWMMYGEEISIED